MEAPGGAGGEFGFGVVVQIVGGADVVRVLGEVVRVGVEADAGGFCVEGAVRQKIAGRRFARGLRPRTDGGPVE